MSGFRYYWGDAEEIINVIWVWNATGPMLNPAFAFGQMLIYFDFTYILEYVIAPFGGAALALIFYEFIFVKTQEILDDDDDDGKGSMLDGLEASPPSGKNEKPLEEEKEDLDSEN